MITIIHGEDIASSRRFFIDERQKILNPIIFNGESLSLSNLSQALESNSLFVVTDKEIFIEDFFSKKPSQEFGSIILYLQKRGKNSNIKIWEPKELSKKQLSSFKDAAIKLFSFPKFLFPFLNELKHKNGKKLICLFHKALESTEAELIFYMTTRQLRLLLAILEDSREKTIDEIKNMAPWQKSKLQKQASFFTETNLKNIYSKICSIEIAQKTGASFFSLSQAIDFLLLSI